jgi:pimeloyl-ACP methyl ester carboxylesterase
MRPFKLSVDPTVLEDLTTRLARTRWPDHVTGGGWSYGTDIGYLQELVEYWQHDFDWRRQESLLNRFPQFISEIDGLDIHFLHARGQGPDPFPLIITHGWPSSFFEAHKIIGPLADPASHGGDPADAFHVVVPSLPGFGFSERPVQPGFIRVDRLWRKLMVNELGYDRFGAHGTDIGARVTSALGGFHGDVVAAIHLGSVDLDWPDPIPDDLELSQAETDYMKRVSAWQIEEGAYDHLQSTRPQTLAYGLNDSPVGLAAWIVEKLRSWSDCEGEIERRFTKDEILTNVMIYWIGETINASMRRYYEARHDTAAGHHGPNDRIETPTGIAMFPGEAELVVPRQWAERRYNIVQWTDMPAGGHFPAIEEPALLIDDIRAFFRPYRSS